jgi:alkanesulfonate monooxygenase SsuD/methylene tetrahydromethanopterin reductase-like flavin-dependent oxidoreductase (luciferase family)
MHYGVTLPITGVDGSISELVDLAQVAEVAGWDGIFLEDYIVYWAGDHYPVYDPWLTLAAMAMRTSRIRLGTTVTPLARRRPWKVAREAITLDHLSNGRLIVGLGLGDSQDKSFTGVSGEVLEPRVRAELLDEGLEILAGLWTGRPFSYAGKHYQLSGIKMLPVPLQQPRIPLWVGGFWPRRLPALRAARWDGFCAAKVDPSGKYVRLSPEDVAAMRIFFAQHRTATTPFEIITEGSTPGQDLARARDLIRPFAEAGLSWWIESLPDGAEAMRQRIQQGPPRAE